MGKFLIVSTADALESYKELAGQYRVGFEINDFYNPKLLDDEQRCEGCIQKYLSMGVPQGSTMHGAFFDVSVFSYDTKIREISKMRMRQSMEIASKLHVEGVVFHTNYNPVLSNPVYDRQVVEGTCEFVAQLLQDYPDINIYLENMFDSDPELLGEISAKLYAYSNYGVCLDYAHAHLSNTPIAEWIEVLQPYIRHVHINDNDLKKDLHQAVGTGKIDWEIFRTYYEILFCHCTVLIETTDVAWQKQSLEYIKKLLGRP